MKAFDSSALLALLEGDRAILDLTKRLRGVEIVSTEANLLELEYLAARGPTRLRRRRTEALGRVRRKLTVLPIDSRAVEHAARHLAQGAEKLPALTAAMLGALEGAGCEELFTYEPDLTAGPWRLKVTRIRRSYTNTRK
jgi:predicted nucleic acid-binding protein